MADARSNTAECRLTFFNWMGKRARRPRADLERPLGIPRTLFYYLHPRLWETFFRQLGIPVVLSPLTHRATIERAGLISEPEHCLPVKLLDAHLDALADNVDRVFVPRILSTQKGWIACPKLGALPDVVRAQFGDRIEVLSAEVDENRVPLADTLNGLGRQTFGLPASVVQPAVEAALREMEVALRNPSDVESPASPSGASTGRFLLIGHPYNLYDAFMSDPVCRKLKSLGAQVRRAPFDRPLRNSGSVRWDTCAHLYETLREASRDTYDGVIHLASFNCGCDSIAGSFFRDLAVERRLPFMTLTLDEHAAQAGVETRLEAFVDSIGARR